MEKYDWADFMKINTFNMKLVGLWPPGENYKFNLYGVWSVFWITTFTFGHPFFQLFNITFIFSDIKTVMAIIYICLSEVLAFMKAWFLVKNMKTIKQLLVTLNTPLFQPRNKRQTQMIQPLISFWKWNINFYWMSMIVAVFFWSTYPIFDGSFQNKQLPFIAWYPHNTTVSPNYQITYLYQVFGVAADGFTGVSTDSLVAALHVYIACQFDILCDDIQHLHDKYSTKKVSDCVKHHKAILKFAKDSAKFTNWAIFGQFFGSGLAIGITMFHMTTVVVFSSEFFSIITYLFSIMLEIFIYCYFGNEVELKSSKIPYAFFESEWINSSNEEKRAMIIMIERCKNPLKISALNLFYLTLETFMRILRVAWSYFALLHQITATNEDKQHL